MDKKADMENIQCDDLALMLHEVWQILDSDDGRSISEKKTAAIRFLDDSNASDLCRFVASRMMVEAEGKLITHKFWDSGDAIFCTPQLSLRKVNEDDRENFLFVRNFYSPKHSFLPDEIQDKFLWSEHASDASLMFSVFYANNYIGYCGIKDVSEAAWEIVIELKAEYTGRGIGAKVISSMLDEIKRRMQVSHFRVRIEPTNYSSQKLFEKLGATPAGITKFPLLNTDEINDNLMAVADKFSVSPEDLSNHVLEYILNW